MSGLSTFDRCYCFFPSSILEERSHLWGNIPHRFDSCSANVVFYRVYLSPTFPLQTIMVDSSAFWVSTQCTCTTPLPVLKELVPSVKMIHWFLLTWGRVLISSFLHGDVVHRNRGYALAVQGVSLWDL